MTIMASLNSVGPCFVKRDAVNRSDHVDAYRRDADLKDCARRREIGFRQVMQWSTECGERSENSRSIGSGRADPDVEVLGRARAHALRARERRQRGIQPLER